MKLPPPRHSAFSFAVDRLMPPLLNLMLLLMMSLQQSCQAAFNLTILHVNDHHSHLEGEEFVVDVADLPFNLSNSTLAGVTVPFGGFGRLKTLLNKYGSAAMPGKNVLKLHAGDALVGTPIYSIFQSQADAALLKELCFDAFCLGNHEFDDGDMNLAIFITALRNETSKCSTAVLSANVVPGTTSPLRALQQSGDLGKSLIVDFDNDERVGIVGINIRNKTLLSSRPDPGTTLLDERQTALAEVQNLTAAGVNKIILLTHIGYEFDLAWMVDIPNVDIVVGGDSHTLLGADNGIFNPVAPYPGVQSAVDNRTVCVVQAWEFGHGLGKLDVEFDDNGRVVRCKGSPIFPIGPPELQNATDAAAVTTYLVGLGDSFVPVVEDNTTMMALQNFTGQLSNLLEQTIATVPKNICFERIPGQGRSRICPVETSASQGGGVCNLVAQAFLSETLQADVAIQNGGGCRTDIAAGNFTYGSAYLLLPFSNTLVLLELTGSEIKLVLEQALENTFAAGNSGSYPYAAGLRYDVDANGNLGSRISGLEYNERLGGNWSAINMTARYSVVTNDFIAAGLDGYTVFAGIKDVVNTQTAYAQAFIDYAIAKKTLLDPPLTSYSTKSFVPLKPDEPEEPMDESGTLVWGLFIVMVVSTFIVGASILTS